MQLTPEAISTIRSHWKGQSDFIGHFDAESDSQTEGWQQVFVPVGAANRFTHGQCRIVVGRKGSGKTALRIWAQMDSRVSTPKNLTINASADELVAKYIATIHDNPTSNTVHVWMQAFQFEMMTKIAESLTGKVLTSESLQAVRKWGLENGYALHDFAERFTKGAVDLIPKLSEWISLASSRKMGQAQIAKVLSEMQVVFYVDDFDNISSRNLGLPAVQAAIEAADRLSSSAKGPKITLLLREDLWLLVRHEWHYADKLSHPAELRWSTEELQNFVHHRLRRAAAEALKVDYSRADYSFGELWNVFFPSSIELETGEASQGFSYILRKTLQTPRDLQSFLQKVGEHTDRWPAGQDAIVKAEERFSADRMSYLATEFGSMCSNLAALLNSFSGHGLEWDAVELQKHLKGMIGNGGARLKDPALSNTNPHDMARFLFRIGFLEVRYHREDGSGWERRDSLTHPTHWEGIRSDSTIKWAVRSVFFRYLRSHGRANVFERAKMAQQLDEIAKG